MSCRIYLVVPEIDIKIVPVVAILVRNEVPLGGSIAVLFQDLLDSDGHLTYEDVILLAGFHQFNNEG